MEGNGDGLKEGRLGLGGRRNGAVGFRVRVWESGVLEEGKERRAISMAEIREEEWTEGEKVTEFRG